MLLCYFADMVIDLTLLGNPYFVDQPREIIGWMGWLILLSITLLLLVRWRRLNKRWTSLHVGIFIALLLACFLTSLFAIVRLSGLQSVLPASLASSLEGLQVPVLAATSWVLAAGLLGVFPAALFGLLSGFLIALLVTHNPFTILEYGLLAILCAAAFHQHYRTWVFRLLRRPLFSSILFALAYPLLFTLDLTINTQGSLAGRLDVALAQVEAASISLAIQLLLAGLIAEAVAFVYPRLWGYTGPLEPSPVERRLQSRFLSSLAPLALLLVVGLMAGDWIAASRAATNMIDNRLQNSGYTAAKAVPPLIERGQNLIRTLANNPIWISGTLAEKNILMGDNLSTNPYFSEIYLLDANRRPVTGYPANDFNAANPSEQEQRGITYALNKEPLQLYTLPPALGQTTARLSFIIPIIDKNKVVVGVLVGRTDLASNPFAASLINSLKSLTDTNGQGMLLDDNSTILYATSSDWVMRTFTLPSYNQGLFFDGLTPDGVRSMMYYQPVSERSWGVVVAVPAQEAQQIALQIAAPLMVIIIILFLIAALVLRFSLRTVTSSLRNLALETKRISSGQLDRPLETDGNDEVGQLRIAFENMRTSLKARLDELNRLVQVSRGVASSLEFQESVKPVMEAAMSTGATAVRVVLSPEALPEMKGGDMPVSRFGYGRNNEQYSYLDDQILPLTRQKEVVALNNLGRVRLLNFPKNAPRPEALLALPLHHENMFYGALWLAYDAPHQFTEDEIRFLTTIAGQAALASSNAQLFSNAEIGHCLPGPIALG
jgi:HAMP domain-containing protein